MPNNTQGNNKTSDFDNFQGETEPLTVWHKVEGKTVPDNTKSKKKETMSPSTATNAQYTATRDSGPITIIPLSQTAEEYRKAGLRQPYSMHDDQRETFERRTKGVWTRKVNKIRYIRDESDAEWLDWDETRTGKTDMNRSLSLYVSHVPEYKIPKAQQRLEFDEESETNRLVNTEVEESHETVLAVPFSKQALDELLKDAAKDCSCSILEKGSRKYTVSKSELKRTGSFTKLYSKKSGVPEDELISDSTDDDDDNNNNSEVNSSNSNKPEAKKE